MKIAAHHEWKDKEYVPNHDWPGDTYVQWGGNGIVLGKEPYWTAFFEAFPDKKITTAGGFIRGEGKTIEEAEDAAWAIFQRENSCRHLWGREKYTNSGQLCRHCRAFRSGHIKEIVHLGAWRKPVSWYEANMMEGGSKYARILRLRASVFGVLERPKEIGISPEQGSAG